MKSVRATEVANPTNHVNIGMLEIAKKGRGDPQSDYHYGIQIELGRFPIKRANSASAMEMCRQP